jgi:aminoglycoside phosphotransferase (APT) family kinase protein
VSTDLPWRSERELEPARVVRVVDRQFPHLAPSRAEFLAEGWDSDAYLVNDDWVLRFPKRKEVEAGQDVERALLPRLAPLLPLPIPRPALLGTPCVEFPFRFLGYARIGGEPAESFPVEDVDALRCARALGSFLSRLHAFPIGEARALGVREPPPLDPAVLAATLRSRWADVAPVLPHGLREREERFFTAVLLPSSPLAPRLAHDDLRPDHILLDANGTVAGVIDWGDAALGDPAADFAGLVAWLGEPFARAVLEHYEGDVDADFLRRARGRAARSALSTTWGGVRRSSAPQVAIGLRSLGLALAT